MRMTTDAALLTKRSKLGMLPVFTFCTLPVAFAGRWHACAPLDHASTVSWGRLHVCTAPLMMERV